MPSGESSVRRRTLLCAATLAASALLAPIATWSTGSALGTTSQSITFGVLLDRTLSDPALHVAAAASSGLPVTFTTTTPTVCSASGTNGTTISPDAVGTCTVQANQAGDATFAPAPPVAQSFDVTKATQTISFAALPDRSLNAGAFTVTATSSSGGAVTFTTTTTTVCTASGAHGATIALVAAGTCTVQADQPGNGIFAPAPTETQSFAVGKTAQAITFGALTDKSVLQTPVTVSATATSLLPVTFTTTTPATCTAAGTNGATITLVGSGTCTVQADQAGNASFSAAPPVVRSFTVTRAPQTITFAALTARTTLQSPFAVTATSTSVLTVTFTTTTPAVCGAGGTNGSTITLVTAGTCTLQADQPGNAVFSPASSVFQSFTVTKADQTITFGALANHTVLEGPIAVSAASTSGLAVTFTTTTLAVCTSGGTNGATITLVAAGTCTVVAAQGGDATFNAATPVAEIFTVARADQAIAFAALPDVPLGTPVTVAATATSGLAVSFSTSTPAVCTASSATITLVAAGTCTVVADQTGDAVYNAAPSVARSFGVGKTDQTITFAPLPDVAVTHAPITVSATASSLLPVTFTTTTPAVCTANGATGATITLLGSGVCTVAADQPGNEVYNAAPTLTRSFVVTKLAQQITFAALPDLTLPHAPVTVAATASSQLPVTFTSTAPGICTTTGARGTKVTFVKAGTCALRADQAGDGTFAAAPAIVRHFGVMGPVVAQKRSGYWMLGSDGHVYAFGNASDFGSAAAPAVAFAARRDGTGYWVVDAAGAVRAFGRAAYHGGRPALAAGESVSTISVTPTGNGYWLFTSAGRAFAYGDARFFGDLRGVQLNGPVVASVATPTGLGYYMVGSDGGVFSFGDARFHGSMGGAVLNRPIVGLSPTPDNRGYWLVASDGGVFAFGAPFRGSLGNTTLNKPVNGLVAYGNGYLMVASDGGVFDFSDKAFVGSLGATPPAAPIVGIASM